ncbi:sensor histidine kinase [Methyloraptor flagellatus]|uniref:histidine kinase n=1 Tax=Methyloraptor flagellatus TaxID=3162530 RepID=A0AAU7X597_9HYPH
MPDAPAAGAAAEPSAPTRRRRALRSLRSRLLAWLLVPLAALAVVNVVTTWRTADVSAGLVVDRMLTASARVIAEQVKDQDGVWEALIPPSALEMFQSQDRDRVVYRVLAPDGALIAGYPDLTLPPRPPTEARPVSYDTLFRAEPIRVVALSQPVVGRQGLGHATVIVGQTLKGRTRIVTELWTTALGSQLVVLAAAGLIAVYVLSRGLAPVGRLGRAVAARDPNDRSAIARDDIPSELLPLVDALDAAFRRVGTYVDLQRRFIADAAHQLRTPLAVMKTQAAVGLDETTPEGSRRALVGLDRAVDGLTRLVRQLLMLARAEQGPDAVMKTRLDLRAVTVDVLDRLIGFALDRRIDLGFEAPEGEMPLAGHPTLIGELIAALVENALTYTPEGGEVAVRLGVTTFEDGAPGWRITVIDTGPGIPEVERERVFERFHRGRGVLPDGTGLGLAIVREAVEAHRGTVTLADGPEGRGLQVEVRLPAGAA